VRLAEGRWEPPILITAVALVLIVVVQVEVVSEGKHLSEVFLFVTLRLRDELMVVFLKCLHRQVSRLASLQLRLVRKKWMLQCL